MPFTVFPITEDGEHGIVSVWNELRSAIIERGSPIFLDDKTAPEHRSGNDGGDLRTAIQTMVGGFPSFDGSVWIDTGAHPTGDISGYVYSAGSPNFDSAYFWTFDNLLTAAGLFPATGVGPSPAARVNARYWNENYQAIRRLKSVYINSTPGLDAGAASGNDRPVYILSGGWPTGTQITAYKRILHHPTSGAPTSNNILSVIGSAAADISSPVFIGTLTNAAHATPPPAYDEDQLVAMSINYSFNYV